MTVWRAPSLVAMGAAALLVCRAAGAVTWYTVEVLVFAERSPDLGVEVWPAEPRRPDLAGSLELTSDLGGYGGEDAGATPHAFRRLPDSELELRPEAARLRRSGRYAPLLHVAWRQPGDGKSDARPVHVTGIGAGNDVVDGLIRLWVQRFLHVEADLLYRPDGGDPSAFRLRQSRRMRSRELHYLDHPAFGALVRVTPFELPRAPAPGPAVSSTPAAGTGGAVPGTR